MSDAAQHTLFGAAAGPERFTIDGGELLYWPDFLTLGEADRLFLVLRSEIAWQQQQIRMYNKYIDVPRLTAWYGDRDRTYRWSGIDNEPIEWTPELEQLRETVSTATSHRYNSVLLNLYRDGNDGVAWHADDEPELGTDPIIASLSLGAERTFQMKHRHSDQRFKLSLTHGSLLLMGGTTQTNWLHQIPKSRQPHGARINLTFRYVHPL